MELTYVKALVVLAVLSAEVQAQIANPLRCRLCSQAQDLSHCTTLALCDPAFEECYMEQVVNTVGSIVYNGGCKAKDVCAQLSFPGVGKRSDLVACTQCCSNMEDDGCNKNLCGIKNPHSGTNQCYYCGSGSPQAHVTKPEKCITLTQCASDEVCIVQAHAMGSSVTYEYGCGKTMICQLLTRMAFQDLDRCSVNPDSTECGFGESAECTACCGWENCNYGTCRDVRNQTYQLNKAGLFDMSTLSKIAFMPATTTTRA